MTVDGRSEVERMLGFQRQLWYIFKGLFPIFSTAN